MERLAAHHLEKVGQEVEAWSVVKTALAMFIMQEQRPARFSTDTAFDFQLVRRVRGLADSSAGATGTTRNNVARRSTATSRLA